jgi:fructose-1,6-bisphosphatase II
MSPAAAIAPAAHAEFRADAPLVADALAATRAAALAASAWAGRGDPHAADAAATTAMRTALGAAAETGIVVTGEGAKDAAPMLADGELTGAGAAPTFDIAVDPLECTDLCARGLPGALSTIAVAPRDSLWSPGPAYYMSKLVVPRAARAAAQITDPPEVVVEDVAEALGKRMTDMRIVVLDKPRHRELISRLRALGAVVRTPPAGDVAGALEVLLPDGGADLLLGIGGTPEGVLAACAARALGGGMQGQLAPQRDDEREAIQRAGLSEDRVLELDDLVAADAAFVAAGVTGGLLGAPRRQHGWIVTESIVIAARAVRHIHYSRPDEE